MADRMRRKAARWVTGLTIVALALASIAAGQSSLLYIYDRNGNLLRVSNTRIDPQNCGGPGIVCPTNNLAEPLCRSGTCSTQCMAGYAGCDSSVANGCETALNTTSNCGRCGIKCSTNHITAACGSPSGPCNGTCASAWEDCDGNKQSNGCEVNITSDTHNCGGCGHACSTNGMDPYCVGLCNTQGSCAASYCNGTCWNGRADCDNNKANGCEAVMNDNDNCGRCGVRCTGGQVCRIGYNSSTYSCS